MKKYANWITAIAVVLMLTAAVSIRFSPESDFKDLLLKLSELPKTIFSFVWESEEAAEPTEPAPDTLEQQKVETPFLPFDDAQEGEETDIPLQTISVDGVNQLPIDVVKGPGQ